MALEVVLKRWLGGQMGVGEVGWQLPRKKHSQKTCPWTLPAATVMSGSVQCGFHVI